MARKRVFISFDWDNDRQYKFLLNAWAVSNRVDLSFNDQTPREIKSDNLSRIKAAITAKIKKSTYTLLIVGKEANKRHKDANKIGFKNWINFEINKSKGNTKIRVLKLRKSYVLPEELRGTIYRYRTGYSAENIADLLK